MRLIGYCLATCALAYSFSPVLSATPLLNNDGAPFPGLTMTLDTANLSTIEGSGPCSFGQCASLVVIVTISNTTGQDVFIDNLFGGGASFLSGDPTDSFINSTIGPADCRFRILSNGSSCDNRLTYWTAPDVGEIDGDFGVNVTVFSIFGTCEPGSCVSFQMTVNDPAVTSVPEPATMLLLGTGLVGMGVRRWRTRRQRS